MGGKGIEGSGWRKEKRGLKGEILGNTNIEFESVAFANDQNRKRTNKRMEQRKTYGP